MKEEKEGGSKEDNSGNAEPSSSERNTCKQFQYKARAFELVV